MPRSLRYGLAYYQAIPFIALFSASHAQQTATHNLIIRADRGLTYQYSAQDTPLLDLYVAAGDEDQTKNLRMTEDRLSRVNEPGYSFRTGFNYKFNKALALNFDARRRKLDTTLNLSDDEDNPARLKFNVKPWEFRLGVSYKWGAR